MLLKRQATQRDQQPHAATCPHCRAAIATEDLNMQQGVGLCRGCNKLIALKELAEASETAKLIDASAGEPPDGCWCVDSGHDVEIGATQRSLAGFFVALFVCLFWNGIVSVFVLVNIASTLKHLGITLPSSFPAPKMNGADMSAGMTIFLWIFLTPFMLVGFAVFAGMLMTLAGHTRVTITREEGRVFSGIGNIGWTRRFDVTKVTGVRHEDKSWTDSDGDRRRQTRVIIDAEKPIEFGSSLTPERRKFIAGRLAAQFG